MAQFSAGMEDQAVRTLEAGVTRFPKDAMHYQALGVVLLRLSETGRATKDRARVLFQKAIEIDPALPEAHYELGTMALAANDVVAAKDHLLIAERSSPADSRVHFALARLYRMQGDTKNADREMQSFFAAKSAEQPGRVAALGKGEQ
jgi:Flp pilus assembly protein TadD